MRTSVLLSICLAQVALAAVFIGDAALPAKDDLYIAVFKADAAPSDRKNLMARWAQRTQAKVEYHNIGKWHAVSGPFKDHIEDLLKEEHLEYVEANHEMKISQSCQQEKDTVTWGLQRLNEHELPQYDYTYRYSFDAKKVDAYILDTGIEVSHPQFEGRATWGFNAVDNEDRDCQGHGTHVAGTVGSKTYGVAKEVSLFAVKFLGCDGSGSNLGMIKSMDWISAQAAKRKRASVVNVSAGGPYSRSVNEAMTNAISGGVTYVVAAGNEAQDACDTSPASCAAAITVGATDKTDTFASFSNFGSCVDILAPGVAITSTWIGGATNTISGTSMASPHVAGVAVLVAGQNSFSPAQVFGAISKASTSSIIKRAPSGTVNKLAFVTCSSE